MKKAIITIFMFCLLVFFISFESMFQDEIAKWFPRSSEMEEVIIEAGEATSTLNRQIDGVDSYIGRSAKEITEMFGHPQRQDLSAYGYVWWIYPHSKDGYLQFGLEDEIVVTAFSIEDELGKTYEELDEKYTFTDWLEIKNDAGVFAFELTTEDLKTRPLVNVGETYIQFYFDTFTGTLSSTRMLNAETLLKHRPYSISYRGDLPSPLSVSDEEWALVEKGEARQIFDLTNIIRARHQLERLTWAEDVATVAYLHSKEMSDENYFSHESPIVGDLQARFEKGKISFQVAGENIAAQYVDGIASVEGWLNSEGHRVNLLHEEFSHLGVGVYRQFYTQNFLIPVFKH